MSSMSRNATSNQLHDTMEPVGENDHGAHAFIDQVDDVAQNETKVLEPSR